MSAIDVSGEGAVPINDPTSTINTAILAHLQNGFNPPPPSPGSSITVDPELATIITKIISDTIMQIQPIIMNTVSTACSKMFSMFLDHLKQNAVVPQQTQAAATPLQDSLALDMKKQLRQQAYTADQIEQDNRANIIRIKGVTPECEDLKQDIINVARDAGVTMVQDDITSCYLTKNDDAPARRIIVAKLRLRSKKVEVMRNKKNLTGHRYVEEGLTRLRFKLYHTVRLDRATGSTWTQDGKIMTYVKDGDGNDVRKIITTPDDLIRIGYSEQKICKFWDDYNQ